MVLIATKTNLIQFPIMTIKHQKSCTILQKKSNFSTWKFQPIIYLILYPSTPWRQLTIDNGLFQPIILYPSTPWRQLKIDNGLFRPIRGLKSDHMNKIDQSACSNCNNCQKDQNNGQYIKSQISLKIYDVNIEMKVSTQKNK